MVGRRSGFLEASPCFSSCITVKHVVIDIDTLNTEMSKLCEVQRDGSLCESDTVGTMVLDAMETVQIFGKATVCQVGCASLKSRRIFPLC